MIDLLIIHSVVVFFICTQAELTQSLQQLSEKAKSATEVIQRLKSSSERVQVTTVLPSDGGQINLTSNHGVSKTTDTNPTVRIFNTGKLCQRWIGHPFSMSATHWGSTTSRGGAGRLCPSWTGPAVAPFTRRGGHLHFPFATHNGAGSILHRSAERERFVRFPTGPFGDSERVDINLKWMLIIS